MSEQDPRGPEVRLPALVIFDCDGVLVDSEPLSNAVLADALSAAGLPTSAAQALREYKGRLMQDVVDRAEARLGSPLPAGFVEEYERDRMLAFRRSLQPVPGAAEAVRAISAAGVGVCVASQGKLEKTELTLTLTGLRDLFGTDALFSAYSVPRGKPHPDLFLHAARAMGAAPEHSVVVEDTVLGVTGAAAAGMRVFGYAPGVPGAADGPGAAPGPGAALCEAGALEAADATALRDAGAEVIGSLAELPTRIGIAP